MLLRIPTVENCTDIFLMCILKNHKISNNINVTFEIKLKINCEISGSTSIHIKCFFHLHFNIYLLTP
jgi:hypothetical protein